MERQLQAIAENEGDHRSICRKAFPHNSGTHDAPTNAGQVSNADLTNLVAGPRAVGFRQFQRCPHLVQREAELTRAPHERQLLNVARAVATIPRCR